MPGASNFELDQTCHLTIALFWPPLLASSLVPMPCAAADFINPNSSSCLSSNQRCCGSWPRSWSTVWFCASALKTGHAQSQKTQPTYLSAYLFKSDCRHEPGPEFQKLRSESHRPLGVPIFIPPSKLRGNFMPFVQMLGSRLCPEDTAPTRACPLSFGLNLHYAPLQPRLR